MEPAGERRAIILRRSLELVVTRLSTAGLSLPRTVQPSKEVLQTSLSVKAAVTQGVRRPLKKTVTNKKLLTRSSVTVRDPSVGGSRGTGTSECGSSRNGRPNGWNWNQSSSSGDVETTPTPGVTGDMQCISTRQNVALQPAQMGGSESCAKSVFDSPKKTGASLSSDDVYASQEVGLTASPNPSSSGLRGSLQTGGRQVEVRKKRVVKPKVGRTVPRVLKKGAKLATTKSRSVGAVGSSVGGDGGGKSKRKRSRSNQEESPPAKRRKMTKEEVKKKTARSKKVDSKLSATARKSKVQPHSPRKSTASGSIKQPASKHVGPKLQKKSQKKSESVGRKSPSVSLQKEQRKTTPPGTGPAVLVQESQGTSHPTPMECVIPLVNNGKGSYEEEAAWTCSSDDDFAVSQQLEELQRRSVLREMNLVTVDMSPPAVGQGVEIPMVCLPPEMASSSTLATQHSGQQQGACEQGDAGHQPQGGALEIDPSALEIESRALVTAANAPVTAKGQTRRKKTVTSVCKGGKLGKTQRPRVRAVGSSGQIARAQRGRERDLGGKPQKKKGKGEKEGKMTARGKPRKGKEEEPKRAHSRPSKKEKEKAEVKKARGRPRKKKDEESKQARGRPRKEKDEESKKARGRPRKEKEEELKKVRGKVRKEEGKKKRKGELEGKVRGQQGTERAQKKPRAKLGKEGAANKLKRSCGQPKKIETSKRPHGRPRKDVAGHPQPLLNSPQNGEDSGYPGSISSSSSHGGNSKSPTAVCLPSLALEAPTGSNTLMSLPLPSSTAPSSSQYCILSPIPVLNQDFSVPSASTQQASVGVAALNLSTIPDQQWVWPSGVGGANTDELFPLNCSLEQSSEVNQPLFEPSKMIISKVESLSEENQFVEYGNELTSLLESEEVVQCLNNLTTLTPSQLEQLQVMASNLSLPAAEAQDLTATTTVPLNSSVPTVQSVCVPTTETSLSLTQTQAPIQPSLYCPSTAESVEAYVAAETSMLPFAVPTCLGGEKTGSHTCQTSSGSLYGMIDQAEGAQKGGQSVCSNVMWSQATDEVLQEEATPVEVEIETTPPPPAPAPAPKPQPQKRRIIRVKRKPKAQEAVAGISQASSCGTTASSVHHESSNKAPHQVSRPRALQKSPSPASESRNKSQALRQGAESDKCEEPLPEVKSTKGRVIKPSWKLKSSHSGGSLKSPTHPERIARVKRMATSTDCCKESTLTPSTSTGVADSGPEAKALPEILASSTSVKADDFPTSSTLSMSLDDILQQMKDDSLVGSTEGSLALSFAESLLASTSSVGGKEEKGGGEGGRQVSEAGQGEQREGERGDRKESKSREEHPQTKEGQSPVRKVSMPTDGSDQIKEADRPQVQRECPEFVATPLPRIVLTEPPNTLPGEAQLHTGSPDSLYNAELSLKPLESLPSASQPNTGELQLEGSTTLSRIPATETQSLMDMSLCSLERSVSLGVEVQHNESESVIEEEDEKVTRSDNENIEEDKWEGTSPSPPVTQRECDEEVEEVEDRIELFAEDGDAFTHYSMEEGKKTMTTPQMPSPPRVTSPLPFKKQQVVEWVEQQRTAHLRPPLPPPPPPLPPPDLHMYHNAPGLFRPPLPPTPPLPPPPPRRVPPANPFLHGRFTSTPDLPPQFEQGLYPRREFPNGPFVPHQGPSSHLSDSQQNVCRPYLRGRCGFPNCKFPHVPRDRVSDSVLEAALLFQPVDLIPRDIAKRYVVDSRSIPISCWFPLLINLIKNIVNKNFVQAWSAYCRITSDGLVLSPHLLSRLLELCSEQTPPLPSPYLRLPELAHELMERIAAVQGSCSRGNYCALMRVLGTCNKPTEVMDAYQAMKASGHPPTLDTVYMVLRNGTFCDERILQLLGDVKVCNATAIDAARISNTVLEKADPQLLIRCSDTVSKWVTGVHEVLDKLGQEALHKLYNLFSSVQDWSNLLVLLEQCPKAVATLGHRLCESIVVMVTQQPVLCARAVNILEMMSDKHLSGISAEAWNVILPQCVGSSTTQRMVKFCGILNRQRKCLLPESLEAILTVATNDCHPQIAVGILMNHMKFVPPVLPSMGVLGKFCEQLEKKQCHEDLYSVVNRLLQCRVAPSPSILQSFMNDCHKEKTYSKLSAVVKKAKESGLQLEKIFYQRALVELRQWGQDQDAITAIYKALRKIDLNCQKGTEDYCRHELSSSLPILTSAASSLDISGDSGRSTPGSRVSIHTSHRSTTSNKSLERLMEKTNKHSDSSILELIEVNGKQGQFGAVVSILSTIQSRSSVYDCPVVEAVWRGVTESQQKPPNAFSSLLDHLNHPPPHSSGTSDTTLSPRDRWLASQLGIALMKMYTDTQHWQSGFVVLHHLHRFGVHYISHSRPPASLPLPDPPPSTPCGLAAMAVTTCLKVSQTPGAVEVLKGCQWISEHKPEELKERTQLLLQVAESCLESGLLKDCWKCLEEMCSSVSSISKFFTKIASVHNNLLDTALRESEMEFACNIYRGMQAAGLPCLPGLFSNLLQRLCDEQQQQTARDLCKSAVLKQFYLPIARGNLFFVTLCPGICRVEIHILLEEHLHRMGRELDKQQLLPLTINYEKVLRSSVEEALTQDFVPALEPALPSGDGTSLHAVVSPLSLVRWLTAHYPTSSFLVVEEGVRQLPSETSGCSTSHCQPVLGGDEKVVESPIGAPIYMESSSECATSDHHTSGSETNTQQNALSVKQQKKQFREAVCRTFVAELKPFYQAGKFNSNEDYTHLVRVLSTHFCKSCKSQSGGSSKWTVTESTRHSVKNTVSQIMSKCSTYSRQSDSELGLLE